jgi:hypothetical protein
VIRDSEIAGALTVFVGSRISGNFTGKVTEVDRAAAVIRVAFNGNTYPVKLRSIIDGTAAGMVLYPAVGSQVFCVAEGNSSHRYYAAGFEQVEAMVYTQGDTQLTVDANGYDVRRGGESLFAILDDLVAAILNMKFTTNMGPTIALVNAPEFQNIQNRIPSLLVN